MEGSGDPGGPGKHTSLKIDGNKIWKQYNITKFEIDGNKIWIQ